jgi:hypothetical protein
MSDNSIVHLLLYCTCPGDHPLQCKYHPQPVTGKNASRSTFQGILPPHALEKVLVCLCKKPCAFSWSVPRNKVCKQGSTHCAIPTACLLVTIDPQGWTIITYHNLPIRLVESCVGRTRVRCHSTRKLILQEVQYAQLTRSIYNQAIKLSEFRSIDPSIHPSMDVAIVTILKLCFGNKSFIHCRQQERSSWQ